ncbi:glutaredoxin-like protein grla [Theileria orientalis]|uniref:Glutaredoxin-like protein grla n=1 Tax=Theileria orientalis TaxID=68886 RepID=A0A976QTL3_THEOR|nr:glutaredoxin-like protein grla [Theileria orientalis]
MELFKKEEVSNLFKTNRGKTVLVVFDDSSKHHLLQVLSSLIEDFKEVNFKSTHFDLVGDFHNLSSLPSILFFEDDKVVHVLEGCSTSVLVTFVRGWVSKSQESTPDKIRRLLRENQVLLFMKGEKKEPFCRFSRAVVEMLNSSGVKFEGYNIFEDPELREELKVFSNWPTYPQLYVNGKLIGGHDIIKELYESNTLRDEIPKECLV